eukprot:7382675-Prymnesium_polylepis.1
MIPRVCLLFLTAPGRQVAFSPPVSAGPHPPHPPSTTSAPRLNPARHASYCCTTRGVGVVGLGGSK